MPFQTLTLHLASTVAPQRLTLHNREHLVAPGVLIVEGVLNGGLVPGDELRPEDWNAIPITLNHPLNTDGVAVSARDPEVLAHVGLGQLYHANLGSTLRGRQAATSLRAELWLDVARCTIVGDEALQALRMLEAQEPLEVSTGFFSETVAQIGTFAGDRYTQVHRQIRPDHLALLPNAVGACSVADGCGAPRLHHQACCTACAQGQPCEGQPMHQHEPGRMQRLYAMLQAFFTEPHIHVLSSARRPQYDGTESTAWQAPTFSDYVAALAPQGGTPATVAEASAALKRRIAAHTLLGDPEAETLRDLAFFPVVNPATGRLNEQALRAVISGRGSQAAIPEAARTSAQAMARRLLNSAFDAGLETNQTDTDLREAIYSALCRERERQWRDTGHSGEVTYTEIYIDAVDATTQTFTYRQGERLRRRRWTMQEGVLTLLPEIEDVQRETTYLPVPTTQERHMPGDAKQTRIDALIANAQSGWSEVDRPMLEAMTEAQLIRLEAQPTRAPVIQARQPATVDEAIATMPAHLREPMAAMSQEYERRKAAAMAILKGNTQNPFTDEELQAMTAQRLEQLVAMAGDAAQLPASQDTYAYAGRGGPYVRPVRREEDEIPAPPDTFREVVKLQKDRGQRAS